MKIQLKNVTVFLMVLFLLFTLFGVESIAQKKFEGYWEAETITKSTLPLQKSKEIEKQKTFYKSGKMKIMDLTDKQDTIFLFDKGLTWTIDHNDKTYYEMTFEQMQAGMESAKEAMANAMKDMSPEDREMMKKMMGNKMETMFGDGKSPIISFKQTGKKKTIKGYKCSQVIMNFGGEPMMEMWLTNKYNLGDDFMKVYQKMGFIKGKIPKDSKINGFPIHTKNIITTGMGKTETETTITKITQTKVPESEFKLPKGYKKIESEMPFK